MDECKLVATGEAVGVRVPKATIINEGWACFEQAWGIANAQIANNYKGQVIRDITFTDIGDAVELKFLLAKVEV